MLRLKTRIFPVNYEAVMVCTCSFHANILSTRRPTFWPTLYFSPAQLFFHVSYCSHPPRHLCTHYSSAWNLLLPYLLAWV